MDINLEQLSLVFNDVYHCYSLAQKYFVESGESCYIHQTVDIDTSRSVLTVTCFVLALFCVHVLCFRNAADLQRNIPDRVLW